MSLGVGHSPSEVWDATLGQLLLRVTRQNYESWLRSTVGLRFEETTLVVSTPTELARDWLSTRMRTVIQQALTTVAGPGLKVRFEVQQAPSRPGEPPLQPSLLPQHEAPLNPRFTFASFLPGDHNRLALVAALDLASNPDTPYSPLFITGAPGNGKTHLLHATAHQAAGEGQRVLLVTAEQFLGEFQAALRSDSGAAFRARFRDLDILLVDDVHNLAGKKATQAEFSRTIAGLRDLGRRVAVAGDHNAAVNGAGTRFASQLHWGLVAAITEPPAAERMRFLVAKTACQGVELPEKVLQYIALRVRSSPRDLEGAVNRVLALARISMEPLDVDFAARALQPLSEAPLADQPACEPFSVIETVARHLGVNPRDLTGPRRDRETSYARHLAMYVLRQDAGMTHAAIAEALGRKDHSTVVHACRQLENAMSLNTQLRADVDAVRARLRRPA